MASNVTMIPPKTGQPDILRVAAYCRVSSDSTDQLHSYAAQIREYTRQISDHDGWEMVDVYADEGLTGTKLDKREDFNRMMADCRKGKIDRILVKSISRFARNTRDCLASLRELSRLGISVYFEKENIDTGTLTTELMVSVSASLAQQESISISQNQRMSYQRRMGRGEFITCKAPFGYRLVDGKHLEVIPEEADQVRWMFHSYLKGYSMDWIAAEMTKKGTLTTDGKPYWQCTTVLYALTNEKYIGDTLAQKTVSAGFPFVKRRNHGEQDQYYIENTHPPIITKEIFEKTQELLCRRSSHKGLSYHPYLLSQKIICGLCGTCFIRRKGRSGLVVWTCRKHDKGASNCSMVRIPEQEFYTAFVRMYNKLKLHEGIVLQPVLNQLDDLNTALQRDNPAMLEVNRAIAQATEQSYNISKLRAGGLLDADACAAKLTAISAQLTQLRAKRRRLLQNDDIEETVETIRQTVEMVRNGPDILESFDETMFASLIERIIVDSRSGVRFRLKGGIELAEQLGEAER